MTYQVFGTHTYAEKWAAYQVTITVRDTGGSVAVGHGSAAIADAAITPAFPQPIINTTEATFFNGVIGSFIDANAAAPITDFKAVIDWGDGTPTSFGSFIPVPVVGTVFLQGNVGTAFEIVGSHIYANARVDGGIGVFTVTVHVVDIDGASTTVINTINVADRVLTITGSLNAASDTGEFNFDGVTKDNMPVYNGYTSEAGARVFLYAQSTTPGSPLLLLGQGVSNASKFWAIRADEDLADGNYNIFATALDRGGFTTSTSTLLASGNQGGPLEIDTAGPKVDSVFLNRANGSIDLSFQDNLSGLDQNQVMNAQNLSLTKLNSRAGSFLINAITSRQNGRTGPDDVSLSINNGAPLRGGLYTFTVFDKVLDVAGNALDGEFYGFFPSGNNIPGGNFVADLDSIHHTIFAPKSVVGNASPDVPPGIPGRNVEIPTIPVNIRTHLTTFHAEPSSLQSANNRPS